MSIRHNAHLANTKDKKRHHLAKYFPDLLEPTCILSCRSFNNFSTSAYQKNCCSEVMAFRLADAAWYFWKLGFKTSLSAFFEITWCPRTCYVALLFMICARKYIIASTTSLLTIPVFSQYAWAYRSPRNCMSSVERSGAFPRRLSDNFRCLHSFGWIY